jgi:hypothetical protein
MIEVPALELDLFLRLTGNSLSCRLEVMQALLLRRSQQSPQARKQRWHVHDTQPR